LWQDDPAACHKQKLHCLFCAVFLQDRFPGVKFSVLNLARGAVDVTPASMCWYQYVPQVRYNTFQKCQSSCTSSLRWAASSCTEQPMVQTLQRFVHAAAGFLVGQHNIATLINACSCLPDALLNAAAFIKNFGCSNGSNVHTS
jgi:hypothetical protein